MSGGYFNRHMIAFGEIANSIECDIARTLRPKPEKNCEDYWTIYEKDSLSSYHSYKGYMSFASYEDAESFLLLDKTIVKAEQKYADRRFFDDGVIFQSKKRNMSDTSDGEQIPVLYSIHHCCYDRYPDEADVLELSDETINAMKEAYRQIRIAEIYATRVDWMEMIAKRASANVSRKIWRSLKKNMLLKTGLISMKMTNKNYGM
jgi:hypothetical protein